MLTFPRFAIILGLIFVLFIVAWNADIDLNSMLQEKNLTWLTEVDSDREAEPVEEDSEAKTNPVSESNDPSPWQVNRPTEMQDFSQIAIRDPDSQNTYQWNREDTHSDRLVIGAPSADTPPEMAQPNEPAQASDSTPGDTGSPKSLRQQWQDVLSSESSETSHLLGEDRSGHSPVEPPPLVGDFADSVFSSNSQNENVSPQKSEQTADPVADVAPRMPSLQQVPNSPDTSDGSQSLTPPLSTAASIPGEAQADPNAPPRPDSLELKTTPFISQNQANEPDPATTRIPSTLPPQKGVTHVGKLRLVTEIRGEHKGRKPIGFVRHVWKAGDSLPELAETYLGSRDRFMEIVSANSAAIQNPATIPQGTVLKIPVY